MNLAIIALAITAVAFIAAFIAALLRLYALARSSDGGGQEGRARERRALESIFKQAGAVAAVIAVLSGFLQFLEEGHQKVASEERTQFAKSMEKIVSNDHEANLGGIVTVGQLGEGDSVRHWAMMEALTDYVRSTTARSQSEIRRDGANTDKCYVDPPEEPGPFGQASNYKKANLIEPTDASPVPAQLALTILGTRETKYEEQEILKDVPRARIYFPIDSRERPVLWHDECTKEEIEEQLERDWAKGKRPEPSPSSSDFYAQLVLEVPHMCPTQFPDILPRPWLNISKSKVLQADLRNALFDGATFTDSDFFIFGFCVRKVLEGGVQQEFTGGYGYVGRGFAGGGYEVGRRAGLGFGSGGLARRHAEWRKFLSCKFLPSKS